MKRMYLFLLLTGLSLFSCVYYEVKDHKAISVAQITGIREGYRGGYYLKYSYRVDGVLYSDCDNKRYSGKKTFDCIGKWLPLVYSKKKPNYSILIVDPKDYERWGIEFPDSLNWIKERKTW